MTVLFAYRVNRHGGGSDLKLCGIAALCSLIVSGCGSPASSNNSKSLECNEYDLIRASRNDRDPCDSALDIHVNDLSSKCQLMIKDTLKDPDSMKIVSQELVQFMGDDGLPKLSELGDVPRDMGESYTAKISIDFVALNSFGGPVRSIYTCYANGTQLIGFNKLGN
jgi:hypothetical protein